MPRSEPVVSASPEAISQVASGLAEKTGSDLCISVTGIAGPGGGTAEKPVGLAYIGIAYKGQVKAVKSQYRNVSRKWNRHYALLGMLNQVYQLIK